MKDLELKDVPSKSVRGTQHYKISFYNDLDGLLGRDWHYGGLNDVGDFCYVVLETACGVLLVSVATYDSLRC